MEDMIKKIVDIDKNARTLNDETQRENIDIVEQIAQRRKEIQEEYLSRARRRIELIREEEQAKADAILQTSKTSFARKSEALKKIYKENGDKWADTIFDRVIGE